MNTTIALDKYDRCVIHLKIIGNPIMHDFVNTFCHRNSVFVNVVNNTFISDNMKIVVIVQSALVYAAYTRIWVQFR